MPWSCLDVPVTLLAESPLPVQSWSRPGLCAAGIVCPAQKRELWTADQGPASRQGSSLSIRPSLDPPSASVTTPQKNRCTSCQAPWLSSFPLPCNMTVSPDSAHALEPRRHPLSPPKQSRDPPDGNRLDRRSRVASPKSRDQHVGKPETSSAAVVKASRRREATTRAVSQGQKQQPRAKKQKATVYWPRIERPPSVVISFTDDSPRSVTSPSAKGAEQRLTNSSPPAATPSSAWTPRVKNRPLRHQHVRSRPRAPGRGYRRPSPRPAGAVVLDGAKPRLEQHHPNPQTHFKVS